ncbi:unnamed protein product [Prunus armeniaca]
MAYVVGEWGKKMVLSSVAKKWKDFKSTLTRQFILPFKNEKEKLKELPQLYNFIEKSEWDAFVASRLSPDFEAVHSEQSQRREKCEYNHKLSRKGYVGLEKAKLIGTLTVSGSNDVLTLALGIPEHGGRVKGVGAGESVMAAVRKETKKMEARAKESVMEAVRVEREIMLKQFSQLIPNFDPNLLSKIPTTPITPIPPIPQEQSPKNPMSDKASCCNVRALELDEDNPTNDADAAENRQDQTDLSKLDMPAPLLALCQYVKAKLKPANETIRVHMPEEMFGIDHETWLLSEDILQFASMVEIGATIAVYMRYLFNYLKMANMVNLFGLVNPGQVSSQSGTLSHCSKHLSKSLKNAYGDQFYLVPYNPGGHWVLIIVRPTKETVYYINSFPNRSVDEDMRNILNTSIKMYNSHTGKQSSRKSPIWKNLQGTPRQPTNVECGYYVMRFIRDIINDPGLAFEKKFLLSLKALGIFSELSQAFDIFSQLSFNIHMDKSWMHADRRSKAYELGVEGFLNFAVWTWHGEPWEWTTNTSRNVEEDEQCGFSFVSEEVGMDDNDLGDIGFDPYEFANVIGDGDQPLYPGSKLLILQGYSLPEGNTLPSSMYEAKKTLSALRMSYEKIHVCPNDCILYRKDNEHSTVGPSQISRPGAPGRGDVRQHVTSFFWMRCGCAWACQHGLSCVEMVMGFG